MSLGHSNEVLAVADRIIDPTLGSKLEELNGYILQLEQDKNDADRVTKLSTRLCELSREIRLRIVGISSIDVTLIEYVCEQFQRAADAIPTDDGADRAVPLSIFRDHILERQRIIAEMAQ